MIRLQPATSSSESGHLLKRGNQYVWYVAEGISLSADACIHRTTSLRSDTDADTIQSVCVSTRRHPDTYTRCREIAAYFVIVLRGIIRDLALCWYADHLQEWRSGLQSQWMRDKQTQLRVFLQLGQQQHNSWKHLHHKVKERAW